MIFRSTINGVSEPVYASELVSGTGGGGGGQDGLPGKSAYQLAVQQGFTGTLDEWLGSLRGLDGVDAPVYASELIPVPEGKEGPPGVPGQDGKDALTFASEITGLLAGPEGKPGKDALTFASEFLPGVPDSDSDKPETAAAPPYCSEFIPTGAEYFPAEPQYAAQLIDHIVTAQDVARKYFDIPAGFPEAAAAKQHDAALSVETDMQAEGEDFEITADGAGKLRRVSWAGLGLEDNPPVQAGWHVTLWYYARLWPASGAGETGLPGAPGESAYELAVREGFTGTPGEWLESLRGEGAPRFASELVAVPPAEGGGTVQAVNGLTPDGNKNVQLTYFVTQAEYGALTPAERANKAFEITDAAAAPLSGIAVIPGGDYSLDEKPVMILDENGVIRQKKDIDGHLLFTKTYTGVINRTAAIGDDEVILEANFLGSKRVNNISGVFLSPGGATLPCNYYDGNHIYGVFLAVTTTNLTARIRKSANSSIEAWRVIATAEYYKIA